MSPRRRLDHGRQEPTDEPVGADHVDVEHALERLGVGGQHRSGDVAGRVGDDDLDGAERLPGRLGELPDGGGVGEVERQCDGVTAGRADGRRLLLAGLLAAGPEHDGMAGTGQGGGGGPADARRRSGDHRRPALGVGRGTGHQRSRTDVGRAAKPRTLTE